MKTPQPVLLRAALALLMLSAGLPLAGCGERWDHEYVCRGTEEARTYEAGSGLSTRRDFAAAIDFHLRGDRVLVKTFGAELEPGKGQVLHFGARHARAWVQGSFDLQDGRLVLIDERTLDLQGHAQQVRTTGLYVCT